MSTLQERMSLAIKHYESETGKRFKNTDLARFAGVSRANVGLWVNGPTQELEGSNLVKAAEFLGVSKDWLAGQSNKMDATKIDNNVSKKVAKLAPVLSWVQAGTFTNVQSVDLSMVEEWLLYLMNALIVLSKSSRR